MRKILSFVLVAVTFASTLFVYADSPSSWAKHSVDNAVSSGIVLDDLSHDYQKNISRKDFCKLSVNLYLKENSYDDLDDFIKNAIPNDFEEYQKKFKDVNYSSYDSKYITVANILGFVNGTSSSKFSPNKNLTREQASKILVDIYLKKLRDISYDFDRNIVSKKFKDDHKISEWARKYVYLVKDLGIMDGTGNNKFKPKAYYTKEQAIVTVMRLDSKYNDFLKSHNKSNDDSVFHKNSILKHNEEHLDAQKDHQEKEHLDNEKENPEKAKHFTKKKGNVKVDRDGLHEQVDITNEPEAIEEQSEPNLDNVISEYKSEVLRLTNIEREKKGVPALSECTKYNDYANLRANEIVEKFDHVRPNGGSCFSGLSGYRTCGENIAFGQRTPEEVVRDWMNSEGHRRNILDPNFTQMSVGLVNENGAWYWVQIFYTPF